MTVMTRAGCVGVLLTVALGALACPPPPPPWAWWHHHGHDRHDERRGDHWDHDYDHDHDRYERHDRYHYR